MWNAKSAISRQQTHWSPRRPNGMENVRDITHAVPPQHSPTERLNAMNPLEPQYQLPSYQEFKPIPLGPSRELNLNIKDIDGTQPVSRFVNRNLHGIPKVRIGQMDVKDINNRKGPHDYLHARGDTYNNLTTNDVVTKKKLFTRNQLIDPLEPQYGERYDNQGYICHAIPSPSRLADFRAHNASLRTDDIAGLAEEKARKRQFYYGDRKEIVDLNYTYDIQAPKQPRIRRTQSPEFISEKKTCYGADQLGQEHQTRRPFGERVCGKTYDAPDMLRTNNNTNKLFVPENIQHREQNDNLKTITQKNIDFLNQQYDMIQKEITHEYNGPAGVDTRAIQCAQRPESVGQLPGPGAEYYGDRDFRRRTHDIGAAYSLGPRRPFQENLRFGELDGVDMRGVRVAASPGHKLPLVARKTDTPARVTPALLTTARTIERYRDGYIRDKQRSQMIQSAKTLKRETAAAIALRREISEVRELDW